MNMPSMGGDTVIKGSIKPLRQRAAWKALARHCRAMQNLHLRKLFADDPGRGERMNAEAAGIFLDYSKNRITIIPRTGSLRKP
jgi:hypothetical protein